MADVLIVCVREDEPQAKALADMFERAGFAVGGAPSNDGALRSSGAAVVVWSQASIRSRPFLDAAQRVVNAKKAVVACLIDPPPSASINNSPAFDLRGWAGDPDDPMLDPLFFGVDRMVNAARAAVGAPATQPSPEPFEPPPSLRPPPSTPPYARSARTAPPQTRQPPAAPLPPGFTMRGAAPPPPASPVRVRTEEQHDPLGSEAEHWRAIRHSNDPTHFLDYLAKYGPDGSFSELAENRLKQLAPEGQQQPPQSPNLRAVARAVSDPPPVRTPPPTARREPSRRREAAFESIPETPRYYDSMRESKRPERAPKQGGAVRVLVLILFLGGAALAGGLYFGMQPGQFGSLIAERDEASGAVATTVAPPPADAPYTDTPPSNSAADPTPPRLEVASSARTPAAPSRTPSVSRERDRQNADDGPTPPPQVSWSTTTPASAAYSGGPVSLVPSASGNDSAANAQVTPQTTPVSLPAASTPAPRGVVTWATRPSAGRVASQYPDRAARNGVGGRVELDCTIRADLGVACIVASETPPGLGFGHAAQQLVTSFRAEHFLSDGTPAPGARVRVPIVFQPPPR